MKNTTYADIAKRIGKQIDKGEKLAADPDKIRQQTGLRIKDRAMKVLMELASRQEQDPNIQKGNKKSFALGGITPALDAYNEYKKSGWIAPASSFGLALGDYFQTNNALSRMKAPSIPIMMPGVILNKNVPIGDQVNDIKTQQAVMDKQAEGFSSQASRFAAKALNSATAQKNLGAVYAQRDKMRDELTNREYLYNHYVNQDNIAAARKHQEEVSAFNNERIGARTSNLSGLLAKLGMTSSEYDTQKRQYLADANKESIDLEKFKFAMKNFDPDMVKRMFSGSPWETLINSITSKVEKTENPKTPEKKKTYPYE